MTTLATLPRRFRPGFWTGIFVILFLGFCTVTVLRFTRGLGAVTNLSDAFPWGLWIGFLGFMLYVHLNRAALLTKLGELVTAQKKVLDQDKAVEAAAKFIVVTGVLVGLIWAATRS